METLKVIASRKSTRSFNSELIPDAILDKIVDAGCFAPNAMGQFDNVHLTVIRNTNLLKEISLAGGNFFGNPGMESLYGATTLVLVSSKPNEYGSEAGVANSACIIENMCLAATDLGVGSVYIAGAVAALSQKNELLTRLTLPNGFAPIAAVALGYSKEPLDYSERTERRVAVNTIQ